MNSLLPRHIGYRMVVCLLLLSLPVAAYLIADGAVRVALLATWGVLSACLANCLLEYDMTHIESE